MKINLIISIIFINTIAWTQQKDTFAFNSSINNQSIYKVIRLDNSWRLDDLIEDKLWTFKEDSLKITLNIIFHEKQKRIAGKKVSATIASEDYLKLMLDNYYAESKKVGEIESNNSRSKLLLNITDKTLIIEGVNLERNHSLIIVYLINKKGIIMQMLFAGQYRDGQINKVVQDFIERNVIEISRKMKDDWQWN